MNVNQEIMSKNAHSIEVLWMNGEQLCEYHYNPFSITPLLKSDNSTTKKNNTSDFPQKKDTGNIPPENAVDTVTNGRSTSTVSNHDPLKHRSSSSNVSPVTNCNYNNHNIALNQYSISNRLTVLDLWRHVCRALASKDLNFPSEVLI